MTIEKFRTTDFEDALPKDKHTQEPMCKYAGFIAGEHCWRMPIKNGVQIIIRSSIDVSGISADCGKDSIRAWLVDTQLNPLGSNVQKYVTRVPGWQERLTVMLRELYRRGSKIEQCPKCKKMKGIFKTKKPGPNKNRLFTSCFDCEIGFEWLEPQKEVK